MPYLINVNCVNSSESGRTIVPGPPKPERLPPAVADTLGCHRSLRFLIIIFSSRPLPRTGLADILYFS
ncbi:hypothetical protein VN97_g4551 [Penicillium thymicola]|uniref:Uncharacterized protein n=2 Tax=Penicillium TaxID=5073 RepID=A0A0M8PIB1_9EURO|nr:hypothetical protein VN97_g4551 [Penicillium thymicola]KOS48240.1 hypothetical protein ACN38_g770 [Penicillium nordicum]